jgi:hypothetical protein
MQMIYLQDVYDAFVFHMEMHLGIRVQWRKPPLSKIEFDGQKYNSYVFDFTEFPGIRMMGHLQCTQIVMYGSPCLPSICFYDANQLLVQKASGEGKLALYSDLRRIIEWAPAPPVVAASLRADEEGLLDLAHDVVRLWKARGLRHKRRVV